MLRSKPSFSYSGLTIVLSEPSRFDTIKLLSAGGGRIVNEECLRPEYNLFQCDIRVKEDRSPLLDGTKVVLLLGEEAAQQWLGKPNNKIGELRGAPYMIDGIPHIASFGAQDAADIKNYEKTHNPNKQQAEDDDDDDAGTEDVKRRHGKTQRKHYAFWLNKDIQRAKYLLKNPIPKRPYEPNYILYPNCDFVCRKMENTKGADFFIDLETDCKHNILCFSISFNSEPDIYCIPLLDHTYSPYYTRYPFLLRALSIAIRDNRTIAFNGATFDFLVLAYKYRIPLGKLSADPMIMHHRCFPEVEKSLWHSMSIWTYEQFHKDEGGGNYASPQAVKSELLYNGKDVYAMKLVYYALLEYAKHHPGLLDSFEQANRAIRPYLTMMLQGIKYMPEELKEIMAENDELMMQYMRCINLMIGPQTASVLQKRFKSALPSSNPQCCLYFHEMLGYPVVGRSKPNKEGVRNPSLAKQNMFKLRLEFNNPVIDFCIAYRETAKESGSLKFQPWRDDNNKVIEFK